MPRYITKAKDGTLLLRFTVRIRDEHGILIAEQQVNRQAKNQTSESAAEDEARSLRLEIQRTLSAELRQRRPGGVPTWGEAVDLYRESCRERGTRLDKEEYRLDILKKELGQYTRLDSITRGTILAWRSSFRQRQTVKRKGRTSPLSPRSVNAYITNVVAILNHAVDVGLIRGHDLHRRLKLEEPNGEVRVLSRLQVEKLLEGAVAWEAASKRNRVPIRGIIAVHYYTAARTGNVLSLRWDQINAHENVIVWPADEVKNRRRIVAPIPPKLGEILKGIAPKKRAEKGTLSGGVFVWGRRWVDIRKAWAGAVQAANKLLQKAEEPLIPTDLSIYCLRHSRATHLARVATPKAVADLLGDDVRTVSRRYFAHDLEAVQEAVKKLDG